MSGWPNNLAGCCQLTKQFYQLRSSVNSSEFGLYICLLDLLFFSITWNKYVLFFFLSLFKVYWLVIIVDIVEYQTAVECCDSYFGRKKS